MESRLSELPHRPPVIGLDDAPPYLLAPLLETLAERQIRCAVIQLAGTDYGPDIPGKDSYELRKAGVDRLLLAAEQKSALIHEHPDDPPDLARCLALLDLSTLDLVLVTDPPADWLPTSRWLRMHHNDASLADAPHCLAYLADQPLDTPIPVLPASDPERIAAFLHATVLSPVSGDHDP